MRQGLQMPICGYVIGNSTHVVPSIMGEDPIKIVGGEMPVDEEVTETEELLPEVLNHDRISNSIEARVVKLSGRGLRVV